MSRLVTRSKIRAFIMGVREFRSDFTTHYDDYDLLVAYDWGREWAHRVTLRRWDSTGGTSRINISPEATVADDAPDSVNDDNAGILDDYSYRHGYLAGFRNAQAAAKIDAKLASDFPTGKAPATIRQRVLDLVNAEMDRTDANAAGPFPPRFRDYLTDIAAHAGGWDPQVTP